MYRSKICNNIGNKRNRDGSKVRIITMNEDREYTRRSGIQTGTSTRVKIFGQVETKRNILKGREYIGKLPGAYNNSH